MKRFIGMFLTGAYVCFLPSPMTGAETLTDARLRVLEHRVSAIENAMQAKAALALAQSAPKEEVVFQSKTVLYQGKFWKTQSDGTLIPCPECNLPESTPVSVARPAQSADPCPCVQSAGACPCPAGTATLQFASSTGACLTGNCPQVNYQQTARYQQASYGKTTGYAIQAGPQYGSSVYSESQDSFGACGSSGGAGRRILGAPFRLFRGIFGCGG